jgi:hypothetical protein
VSCAFCAPLNRFDRGRSSKTKTAGNGSGRSWYNHKREFLQDVNGIDNPNLGADNAQDDDFTKVKSPENPLVNKEKITGFSRYGELAIRWLTSCLHDLPYSARRLGNIQKF